MRLEGKPESGLTWGCLFSCPLDTGLQFKQETCDHGRNKRFYYEGTAGEQ